MIDVDSILTLTNTVFKNSGALDRITETISAEDYKALHTNVMAPLPLKIDVEKFLIEIKTYSNYFEQWGTDFDLPRYGLALVNQLGILHTPDKANGSLMEWNKNHPEDPCLEVDFTVPTPIMNIPSLSSLRIFQGHWYRSNIFKLEKDSLFHPHVDTVVPSPWLRLWATTDSENTQVRFWNTETQSMRTVTGIEAGRIYLIDSSVVHDAHSTDTVHQLFLCLKPSAYGIINDLLWN
jgi:hypothetical protein